jgi:hypothetical protein
MDPRTIEAIQNFLASTPSFVPIVLIMAAVFFAIVASGVGIKGTITPPDKAGRIVASVASLVFFVVGLTMLVGVQSPKPALAPPTSLPSPTNVPTQPAVNSPTSALTIAERSAALIHEGDQTVIEALNDQPCKGPPNVQKLRDAEAKYEEAEKLGQISAGEAGDKRQMSFWWREANDHWSRGDGIPQRDFQLIVDMLNAHTPNYEPTFAKARIVNEVWQGHPVCVNH